VDTLQSLPFFKLSYDKNQQPTEPNEQAELVKFLKEGETTDLFVISHGWNNDMNVARKRYDDIFAMINRVREEHFSTLGARKFAVAGIFWPSMKFADAELIPGGAAGMSGELGELQNEIREAIAIADDDDRPHLEALLNSIEEPDEAGAALLDLFLNREEDTSEPGVSREALADLNGRDLLAKLSDEEPSDDEDGELGGAVGLGEFFGNLGSSIRAGLGIYTFWTMKDRAGKTGVVLGGVLDQLRQAVGADLKIHLMGHSFGARLVTAAANAGSFAPSTMTLMQAAFSHNAFSPTGFFRSVVTIPKIVGPILITHTDKDSAVGLAYPMAVRLSGDAAAGLGGANDKFGGLGANGAQGTHEAALFKLHGPESPYSWTPEKKIFNLEANNIILGHGDLVKDELGFTVLSAVAAV
jgi:hypothetical protein